MRQVYLLLFFFCFSLYLFAQDKIVLLTGKEIPAKNATISGAKIRYYTPDKNKLHIINSERAFSIEDSKGKEQIIYQKDPLDTSDFNIEEMRMFIKGEQDADRYYRNNLNKGVAAILGASGGMLLNIYGLAVPALYSTIVGNTSPNIEKQKVTDLYMLNDPIFREGYERRCRDRKIRNSLIYGYGGFIVGFTSLAILLKK